jgi:ribosome-associated translation inhibitor RaiA
MRISVTDVGATFGRQTRAYAEYRVFSSLARFSEIVRDADISLTATTPPDVSRALCVVTVTVGERDRLQVRARGRHVYDAINRAAQRIGDALRRHGAIALSS